MEPATALRLFDKVGTLSNPPTRHLASFSTHIPTDHLASCFPAQFDLVACAETTDTLAGSAIEALPDLFVDMTAVGDISDSRHYA